MKWKHLPVVAFDTETTGLEPFGGDRIIEIAAVVLELDAEGRVASRRDWSTLVNPERDIPRKVTEITGIRPDQVASARTFVEVADEFREMIANAVTVAHNYPFDLAFLTTEFDRVGMHWPEPLAEVDTVDLSLRQFKEAKSHRLVDLAERLGIELERAHRATDDAAACGLAFLELARRADVPDDLQEMLDWSNAIGRPPEDGPFGRDEHGRIVFLEGPHLGEPVAQHPVHLAWMDKAKVKGAAGWQWRHTDGVRRWVRRWLEVRGAGRARQSQKGFHPSDWAPDPCIALPRARDSRSAAASTLSPSTAAPTGIATPHPAGGSATTPASLATPA
jgi:DNA polymerase III epsilon subunit family exonuclease